MVREELCRVRSEKKNQSRSEGKRTPRKGNHCTSSDKNILSEEAPEAYKNVDRVIQNTAIANLARPVLRLEPMTVIKG